MAAPAIDPIALAQALIRCPSVTPADAGALGVLCDALEAQGFTCHRLPFGDGPARVENLYARKGVTSPNFCFAGHTDVVPAGEQDGWRLDPFAATLKDGAVHGRGAADMKGAIAAFVAAAALCPAPAQARGSISLLITGDEEGRAVNGTKPVLGWLAARGESLDHCLVGEPTNPETLGEMVKIGRRGSLNGMLIVKGRAGHVAYPHTADNPIPRLVAALAALLAHPLDGGSAHFDASNLEVTSVDVGNAATNVIPAEAKARFNVRFNDRHSSESLIAHLRQTVAAVAGDHRLDFEVSGEAFVTAPGPFTDLVVAAVAAETGRAPVLSTSGGTSDARFIKDLCPVVEFGLINQSMHKANECAPVADIEGLARIYGRILERYFAVFGSPGGSR